MRTLLNTLGLAMGLATALCAQTTYTVHFPDSAVSGSTNAFPWNTGATTGYTTVNVYPAATMIAQGIPPGSHLSGIAMVAAGTGTGSQVMPTAKVIVGHLAAVNGPTLWINNMADPNVVWDTAVDGPLTAPGWVGGTWTPVPVRQSNCFFWDGVRDVVIMFSHFGGYTGVYSIVSSPVGYTRHGTTTYMPAPGTAQTTTGVLGPRMRMIFDNASPFAAVTSGFGTGDLTMTLGTLAPGIIEGYTLLSSTTSGSQGSGPFFGLWPDALTWSAIPPGAANYGDPLHWIASPAIPGIWPAAPFAVPPGTLSFLAGQTWEMVAVAYGPNFSPLQVSCVARLIW